MNNLLTSSRMDALLSCPRKHFWSYEVGLRAATSALPLRFGAAWARAMEARWQGMGFDDALAKAVPEGCDLDELAISTLSGLLAGYFARYQTESIKTIHPEVEFKKPLAGSRTFSEAGKIDGLGVLFDDRLILWEAKTTADSLDGDSDYWLRLRFNTQVFQYVLAARALGWNVDTVIYDVTRKPSIEPKQLSVLDDDGRKIVNGPDGQRVFKTNGEPRESADRERGFTVLTKLETPEQFGERLAADAVARPEFYFARREVPILEAELIEFQTHRLTLSKMILHCRAAERRLLRREQAWPRSVSTWNCRGCAYSSFCLQNISIDLDHPPGGFRVGNFNPELTKEPVAA